MKRTYVIKSRGLFNCHSKEPFRVSRSQIEAFVECPRCFWLNHRRGMRRPSSPPFLINTLVDRLLKKEFDAHRVAQTSHPIMIEHGLDAVPFRHPQIDKWRENFVGMQFRDEHTNLNITGAVDDIWQMRASGRLIVVDYKATAKDGQVTLDEAWQDGYKRQMGVYIWLLRKQGFEVEDRGFFLYCNGQDAESFEQRLNFSVSLLPYTGDWIEPTLLDLKASLMADDVPPAPHDCEFCGYIAANQGFPASSTRKPAKVRRAMVGSNRHPADERKPGEDEKQSVFMSRCVPYMMGEDGKKRPQNVAVAACLQMWRDDKGGEKPGKKLNPARRKPDRAGRLSP